MRTPGFEVRRQSERVPRAQIPHAARGGWLGARQPARIRSLFYLCSIFTVLPFFDVPGVGLSVTAPLLLPVMYYAFSQPLALWLQRFMGWLTFAIAIFCGMVVSFIANGPWLADRAFSQFEIVSLVRYLFWIAVFLVTTYVASDFVIQRKLVAIIGVAIVILAGLRCFEGLALGKIGAWTETVFATQNSYGILFSSFTPFLFSVFLGRGIRRKLLCVGGLFVVLFACAINGSRGSWICIGTALIVFLVLSLFSRPAASWRLILPVGISVLALTATLAGSLKVREAVLGRFSTFEDLERDKSYQARQVMNQRSLKLFALSPWFGTGPGRYRTIYVPLEMPAIFHGRSDDDFMRKSSHNSYLSYLAEGGVVASIPLGLLLIVLAFRGALAAMSLNRIGESWALGIYSSFVAMSIHFWSLAGLTGTHAWFVYGLVAATIVIGTRRRNPNRTNERTAENPPVRALPSMGQMKSRTSSQRSEVNRGDKMGLLVVALSRSMRFC